MRIPSAQPTPEIRIDDGTCFSPAFDVTVIDAETSLIFWRGGASLAVPLSRDRLLDTAAAAELEDKGYGAVAPVSIFDDVRLNEALFNDMTAAETDWLAKQFGAFLGTDTRGLDVGCGSGRLLAPLCQHGFALDGLDPNLRALEAARARVPSTSRLIGCDAERFAAPGQYAFAFAALNTLRYLPSHWALRRHFRQLHVSLVPGARYLVNFSVNDNPARKYDGGWRFELNGKPQLVRWNWAGYSHSRRQIVERVRLFVTGNPTPWHDERQLQLAITTAELDELFSCGGWRLTGLFDHNRDEMVAELPSTSGTYWFALTKVELP